MIEIVLPEEAWEGVDANVEGLVDQWLVSEGDRVVAGQPVVRVVLIKTNYEVAAPADGIVEQILVPKDDTFARRRPLAVLREV